METDTVNISISVNTFASLLRNGDLHVADFKCLDANSKKTVWQLLLSTLWFASTEAIDN